MVETGVRKRNRSDGSRRISRHIPMSTAFVLAGAVCFAWIAPASADSCVEQVRRLGDQYALTVDPPDAVANEAPGAAKSQAPVQPGGVIEPPKTRDPSVIEPPSSAGQPMPTLPDIARDADRRGGTTGLSPADLAILESILVAARAEAESGNEADCFAGLNKAKAFIRRERQ